VFADELWLEATRPIPWHIDGQCASVGQHRLGALAVAIVCRPLRLGLTGGITQVGAHLSTQGLLNKRFLELLEDVFQLSGCDWPRDQLPQQLSRNLRQRRLGFRRSGLGLAWHTCSLSSCYASYTKFLTGSFAELLEPSVLICIHDKGLLFHQRSTLQTRLR
jgi:hypothetical protein